MLTFVTVSDGLVPHWSKLVLLKYHKYPNGPEPATATVKLGLLPSSVVNFLVQMRSRFFEKSAAKGNAPEKGGGDPEEKPAVPVPENAG